jgi:hypothetical protein
MGWKALKKHFKIKGVVQMAKKGLCMGPDYLRDMIVINPQTGEVVIDKTSYIYMLAGRGITDSEKRKYLNIKDAGPAELLRLLAVPDVFACSIPVFTIDGDRVLEKMCEQVGYPNITHDGCLMYENTYSTDKETVIEWAVRDAFLAVKAAQESVTKMEADVAKMEANLLKSKIYLLECKKEELRIGAISKEWLRAA